MPTVTESEKNKKSRVLFAALGVLGTALVLYAGFAAWLRIDGRFPFRTTLNGHDVSLCRALDVQQECMDGYYRNMSFRVKSVNAPPYSVTPESFDFSGAERAVSFLPDNMLLWPASLFHATEAETSDGGAIEKLARRIESEYPVFAPESWDQPEDAYLVYDEASDSFLIVPDTMGTAIDTARFEAALERHVRHGSGDLDLSDINAYRRANILSYSPALADASERLNRFLRASVAYTEGDVSVSFAARELLPYLRVDRETLAIRCDAEAAAADGLFDDFARTLAAAFDSSGGAHDFVTHDGAVVPVQERTWRAKLDQEATAAALAALSFDELAAEDGPPAGRLIWERGALDALRNYVEVDLSNQQLYLYTDGEQVLESPIVSGCVAQRHTTPAGAFALRTKARNVTLRGPDYASFVRYWMPFNRGIGLHDANWRRNFGGTIYRANGSHGCINLPPDAAEAIYNVIDESYAIVCYWRPAQ